MDKALRDVREQVDIAKPELPEETDEPSVREVNFSLFPVIDIFLSADIPRHALIRAARDLRDEIEGLAPVLGVNLSGDREEMLEILIDPITVQSYGISPEDVRTLVARSNKLVAAGAQDTGKGRFALKVPDFFETLDDILSLPVKITGDAVVTLGDIGEVRRSFHGSGFHRPGQRKIRRRPGSFQTNGRKHHRYNSPGQGGRRPGTGRLARGPAKPGRGRLFPGPIETD